MPAEPIRVVSGIRSNGNGRADSRDASVGERSYDIAGCHFAHRLVEGVYSAVSRRASSTTNASNALAGVSVKAPEPENKFEICDLRRVPANTFSNTARGAAFFVTYFTTRRLPLGCQKFTSSGSSRLNRVNHPNQ
jgi:hypothetical protein